MVRHLRSSGVDPRYAGFFECFNRQKFYEAHEVLEDLWLEARGANYAFHKGLIQLAGAFVHLQKGRLRPAAALFRLSEANLRQYPQVHDYLDIGEVRRLIGDWLGNLERTGFATNPWAGATPPCLCLEPA